MHGAIKRSISLPTKTSPLYTRTCTHLRHYALLYIGITIHLLFYISVAFTGWFDVFFSGAALHAGAKGIDFYQVPRGAWAFLHGGSFTGDALANGNQYAARQSVNGNVYHPFFTWLVGSFLILFKAEQAPSVWLGCKFAISVLVYSYFYFTFRDYKYIQVALFVLLINMSSYLELAAWQYHFILNIVLLLFLIFLVKNKRTWSGLCYGVALLIKPIGLLFVPALILKRRWLATLIGIQLFLFWTLIFSKTNAYYINNLTYHLFNVTTVAGPNQIITLNALLHYNPFTIWPEIVYKGIQYTCLAGIVLLTVLRRVHLSKAIFLMTAYYVLFYNMTYEYQWSSLAPVIAICILFCPEFQTRFSLFCIWLVSLPSTFIILRLLHIDVKDEGYLGLIPGELAWRWMVLSKVIPLLLLCFSILAWQCRNPRSLLIDFRNSKTAHRCTSNSKASQ